MDPCRCDRNRRCQRPTPRRHGGEGPGFKPPHAQPEAALLPDQHLQLPPVFAQEEEAVTRVWLMAKFMLDHARQQVDATPHVLGLAGHEDPPHRRETQHRVLRQAKATASSCRARSAGTPAVNVHFTPAGVVKDIRWRRRRPRRTGGWTISSMKPGILPLWRDQGLRRMGGRTHTLRNHAASLGRRACMASKVSGDRYPRELWSLVRL